MKGTTLLTLTLVTLAITALYLAFGQPEVTAGSYYFTQITAEESVHHRPTWVDQIRHNLATWL